MLLTYTPVSTGKKLYIYIDVLIDKLVAKTGAVSLYITLTCPNAKKVTVANKDIYIAKDHAVRCRYCVDLPIDAFGRYVISSASYANGKLADQEREYFNIKCDDENTMVLSDPTLSWRDEDEYTVSIFNMNGNILFLKGRLKKIWENVSEGCSINRLADILGAKKSEVQKSVDALLAKGVVIQRAHIAVEIGGEHYEFD